jgi:enoyl-CoA hydratase/carnithine racemase
MIDQRHSCRRHSKGKFMTGHLIVTDEDATRVIKLRRPEKKNAFTQDMYRGMSDAIDTAQNNPDIRCIIVTGGSGVFTAGNDLEELPPEDMTRRIDQEGHLFGERLRSQEAVTAFKAFFERRKG